MKIVGYVRVSTSEQVTEGMSLEAQESKIHGLGRRQRRRGGRDRS